MSDLVDRRAVAAIGLAGGASLLMADPTQAQSPEVRRKTLAQIAAARRRFAQILFDHDHAALAALFTADTLVLPSGKPLVSGRDAAVAFWTAATGNPARRLRSVFEEVDSLVAGDIVVEAGRATVTLVERDHEAVIDRGKYVVVWKREGGRWKRHRDIYNSDAPKSTTHS